MRRNKDPSEWLNECETKRRRRRNIEVTTLTLFSLPSHFFLNHMPAIFSLGVAVLFYRFKKKKKERKWHVTLHDSTSSHLLTVHRCRSSVFKKKFLWLSSWDAAVWGTGTSRGDESDSRSSRADPGEVQDRRGASSDWVHRCCFQPGTTGKCGVLLFIYNTVCPAQARAQK